MYSRMTTIKGDADRIDALIDYVEQTVRPLIDDLPGSLGLAMFLNRDTGLVVVTTLWATAADRSASDVALAPIRGEASKILVGQAQPEDLELIAGAFCKPAQPGFWNHTTRLRVDAGRMHELEPSFRGAILPGLQDLPGFCTATCLADRARGVVLVATTWDSREHLAGSRASADALRTSMLGALDAQVIGVAETQVAIAGIRRPQQHEGEFRRAYAAMSAGGDLADLDGLIAPDVVEHSLPPGSESGLAGIKTAIAGYRQAFPDLHVRVEQYLEQGELACAVIRMTGTHDGPLFGNPPTGRSLDIAGIDVARIVDGRCVEHWGIEQGVDLLAQLGLLTPPVPEQRTIQLPTAVGSAPMG